MATLRLNVSWAAKTGAWHAPIEAAADACLKRLGYVWSPQIVQSADLSPDMGYIDSAAATSVEAVTRLV